MRASSWQLLLAVVVVVGAIVTMFGLTDDPSLEKQLLDSLEDIVAFVVGGAFGLVGGAALGYARAKGVF